MSVLKKVEHGIEMALFTSRWIMAPIYLGLVLSLAALVIKFFQELLHLLPHVLEMHDADVVLTVLALLDISFAGNLIILVIFSGYENFVSRIDFDDGVERPEWMGKVNFNNLKLKLISSIVAISGIHLLRVFMKIDHYTESQIYWLVIIHLTFVASGVLLALADRIVGHGTHDSSQDAGAASAHRGCCDHGAVTPAAAGGAGGGKISALAVESH